LLRQASLGSASTDPRVERRRGFAQLLGQRELRGHNLLGSPNGGTFASKSSDKLNKNAKLGALANNGGPMLTPALQAGRPALNAIPRPRARFLAISEA